MSEESFSKINADYYLEMDRVASIKIHMNQSQSVTTCGRLLLVNPMKIIQSFLDVGNQLPTCRHPVNTTLRNRSNDVFTYYRNKHYQYIEGEFAFHQQYKLVAFAGSRQLPEKVTNTLRNCPLSSPPAGSAMNVTVVSQASYVKEMWKNCDDNDIDIDNDNNNNESDNDNDNNDNEFDNDNDIDNG